MLSKRIGELNKDVANIVLQAIPDLTQKKVSTATTALSTVKARKSEISERLSKLQTALMTSGLDIVKEISASFPTREDVKVDIEDLNYSQGKLKLAGRTVSFEAVDKMKAALEKNSRFKNVATGNVRKGVKDEIKFDITMEVEK